MDTSFEASVDGTINKQASVLIADNDAVSSLQTVLVGEGYTVHTVKGNAQLLKAYKRHQPDLVLLNAALADSVELCRRLNTFPASERALVVFLSNLNDETIIEQAFEAGAADFVLKPVQWPIFRYQIARLLETRRLEKMRDNLTQMIVHDMKNPISTIKGYAEMLIKDPTEGKWRTEVSSNIYQCAVRLFNMAMMILDVGRLEEGKLVLNHTARYPIEILQEVIKSFSWMAHERQVELKIDDCYPEIKAILDWDLIQRVLANLVSNALKHSPEDSVVTLTCSQSPQGELVIAVTDEGDGISLADQEHIFEKFAQSGDKKGGNRTDTGLGLAFCKLATEAQGGRIELESQRGAGSKFTLFFPAASAQ
jgi:two-component system, sensor histidine kinase and response regulator